MATLPQLIYNIRNLASGGMTNRAHPFSDRQIEFWINYYRNILVSRDVVRNGNVYADVEQDLGCLTLTKADAAMCSQYCWGENVYYVCIPDILDLPNNMGLTFFGLVDKQTRIPISEYNYGSYSNFNRFTPRRMYGTMIGNIISVHNVDDMNPLEGVNARIVAANPTNLTACGVELTCFDRVNGRYPIPAHLEQPMMDMILQKELGLAVSIKSDKKADDVVKEPL